MPHNDLNVPTAGEPNGRKDTGVIEFENVSKSYGDETPAVDGLSFVAPAGKITVLVGPSGCGKTTTLRMVNRLIEPSSGRILIDGQDIAELDKIDMRRRMGYVIQSAGLFPHQTVIDNVCAVPFLGTRSRADRAAIRARAQELLRLVGLDESYAARYPWQLSGGQQQRVGVARALASDPPYMLLDEPFSAVDPVVRKQLQQEFLAIQADLAKTIIMVTHDIDEALTMGDQIIVMQRGGVIAQAGTPAEILAKPANAFVSDFLGASRGYHALKFEPLRGVPLTATPVFQLHTAPPKTEELWVVATDADHTPVGWVQAGGGHGEYRPDSLTPANPVSLSHGNHRELLDAALASPTGHAIVVNDDDTYAGTVDLAEVVHGARQALDDERGGGAEHPSSHVT